MRLLKKFNPKATAAEAMGTFILALTVLVSLHGSNPLIPTPYLAGFVLFLMVLAIGRVSGSHINPAVTIAQYSLRKIDDFTALSYLFAQLVGALMAMVVMSMFQNGVLVTQVEVLADYNVFFAEFLGALVFTFGIAASIDHKLKGIEQALLIGGSLTLGIVLASVASNGVINPAVALSIGSINWAYALGPVFGSIIGMNLYALVFGKKGRI